MKKPSGALARQPIRITAQHRGQKVIELLFQHTPVRIGRLVDNDIVLPFDFVSRYHCEIRWENDRWVAIDLGSKNGLLTAAQTGSREIELSDGSEFRVQEVTISLAYATAEEVSPEDFSAVHEAATIIGPDLLKKPDLQKKPGQRMKEPRADHEAHEAQHQTKSPLLNVDLHSLLFVPHRTVELTRVKAIQVMLRWHDQVLDGFEFAVGETVSFEFLDELYELGVVKPDKTVVRVPKSATSIGADPNMRKLTVTWNEPAAFRLSNSVLISFRYVPKSPELAKTQAWVEEKLVDPLLASGAIHGAAAVTALFISPKKHAPVVHDEPNRFATIIVQPTPQQVALQPTPTPTPEPTATPPPIPQPTPEPPKIAEVKPTPKPKPPPPKKAKTVVSEKKLKRPALKRKEDPGVEQKLKPPAKVAATPPPIVKPEIKEAPPVVVAKNEEPAPKPEKIEPPAPTPQPFNAKSVGALKMLSNLTVGPASNVADVEKIQISRAPANVSGSMMGREAVSGTGEMVSKLSQSVNGGGTGKGDVGVAVGGKGAGGQYNTAGLAGTAGKRKIQGSVLGGATYSELSKNEGLTRDQVMKIVQKHQAQIQQCYERSLMQNPDLVGRAEFEWEITPKGTVSFVKVKETTLKNGETLLECVKGIFAEMKFPSAKNGESTTPTIGLPFGRL